MDLRWSRWQREQNSGHVLDGTSSILSSPCRHRGVPSFDRKIDQSEARIVGVSTATSTYTTTVFIYRNLGMHIPLYSYSTVLGVIFFVRPLCLAGQWPRGSFGANDGVCARWRRSRLWTRSSKAFPMRGEGSKTSRMMHYSINTVTTTILLVVVLTHAAVVACGLFIVIIFL